MAAQRHVRQLMPEDGSQGTARRPPAKRGQHDSVALRERDAGAPVRRAGRQRIERRRAGRQNHGDFAAQQHLVGQAGHGQQASVRLGERRREARLSGPVDELQRADAALLLDGVGRAARAQEDGEKQ